MEEYVENVGDDGVRVNVMCPECGVYKIEMIVGKSTSVCRNCKYPVDVYENGLQVESPLADCRGVVRYNQPYGDGVFSMQEPIVRTKY